MRVGAGRRDSLGKRERGGGINRQGKSSSCCGVLTGTQRIGKDGVDIRGAFHDCDFCADITLDDLVSGTNRVAAVEGGVWIWREQR